ncbi:MAG TPA: hypothetical protein VNY08_14145 [Bradyrhizobium sp.]|nr:hypothetical protein [Bradyrhizobium sp.]
MIEDRVPAGVLPWAHDVLCNAHLGPGTRLDRLRTIVGEINDTPMNGIKSGGNGFP